MNTILLEQGSTERPLDKFVHPQYWRVVVYWRMVPALWLSRDHPSNRWIAVDSDILMSGWKNEVETGRKLEHIYVSQKP